MKKVLIAYATNAGSTAKVAQVIGEELGRDSAQVQVCRLDEVTSVEPYDAVVIGAPMIMGWHGAALKFIKKHQQALSQVRVAYFLTAMNLTQTNEKSVGTLPIYVDPALAKPPKNEKRLSFKERYATVTHYLRPALDAAPFVKPVRLAFLAANWSCIACRYCKCYLFCWSFKHSREIFATGPPFGNGQPTCDLNCWRASLHK